MMSSKGNGAKARGNGSLVVCVGGQVGNLVRIQLSTLTTPVSPIIHRHATAVDRHSTASERKERLYQGKLTWTRRDQYSLHLGDEGSQFPTISSRETLLPSPLRSFLLSRSVDTPETRNSECSEAGVDAIARCSRHHRTSTRHKRPIQRRTTILSPGTRPPPASCLATMQAFGRCSAMHGDLECISTRLVSLFLQQNAPSLYNMIVSITKERRASFDPSKNYPSNNSKNSARLIRQNWCQKGKILPS